jgi:hypothetical protein
LDPLRRDLGGFIVEYDVFVFSEKVGEIDAETARQMIVANAYVAQFSGLPRQRSVARSIFERDGHDTVKHLCHLRGCELEIPMSPVPDCRD